MRKTLIPRHCSKSVLAAIAAIVLSVPVSSLAQGTGPRGSGPHGPGMMQGSGPGMQGGMQGGGPGPGMQGNADGERSHMSRHVARFMMLYDLNNDGKVTIEEINDDQARMFAAMDINNDKSMSVDEIRRRGRSLQIFRTTTLFDLLDTNGDGKLSLDEIQAPSKRWFKRYDTNSDGVMDASEVPARPAYRNRASNNR